MLDHIFLFLIFFINNITIDLNSLLKVGLRASGGESWDLGGGGEPAGFAGADALLAAGQDAGDAVGFGEQGGVDHGEAQSGHDARQRTADRVGHGQQRQRCQIAHGHADQDQVGQLARRSLDDGRVVVPGEDGCRRQRRQQTHHRQRHGSDGLAVAPFDVLRCYLHAVFSPFRSISCCTKRDKIYQKFSFKRSKF